MAKAFVARVAKCSQAGVVGPTQIKRDVAIQRFDGDLVELFADEGDILEIGRTEKLSGSHGRVSVRMLMECGGLDGLTFSMINAFTSGSRSTKVLPMLPVSTMAATFSADARQRRREGLVRQVQREVVADEAHRPLAATGRGNDALLDVLSSKERRTMQREDK